jgi:hypothetical protein
MPHNTLLHLFSLVILLSASAVANSNSESGDFQARLNANSHRVDAASHAYGYGFVCRRLFHYIRAGQTFGLPPDDIEIIKNAGRPDPKETIEKMRPFLDELNNKLTVQGNATELASLFEKARRAEQESDNLFYRSVVGQLSAKGQTIFHNAHALEMAKATISEIDFVSLATERPVDTRAMLADAVANIYRLNSDPESATQSSSSSGLGIQSSVE